MAAGPSRVLAFCLLSSFGATPRTSSSFLPSSTLHLLTSAPPPPLPTLSFPPVCVSVCLMSFVSLSGSSQTLRHLLPTDTPDRQTDLLEITSQWHGLEGAGRSVAGWGERRDRCTDRQSSSSGGMGVPRTSITGSSLEEFRDQCCEIVPRRAANITRYARVFW